MMKRSILIFLILIISVTPHQINEVSSGDVICGYVNEAPFYGCCYGCWKLQTCDGELIGFSNEPPDSYKGHFMAFVNPVWGEACGTCPFPPFDTACGQVIVGWESAYSIDSCAECGKEPCEEWLHVKCNVSGYELYINDEYAFTEEGDGNCDVELSAGTYTVKLKKEGCDTVIETVRIECGHETTLRVTMNCNEDCDNGKDDDGDGRIDCDDSDCESSPLCDGESDLSLESVIVSPAIVENGSYVEITLKIKNVGNSIFLEDLIYIQLDFMDVKGSIVGERIIYQLFYEKNLKSLMHDDSETILLKNIHIQDHDIIKKTVVIDALSVKIKPSSRKDDFSNNQKRVPISVILNENDIVNCCLMWVRTYLFSHGMGVSYDIHTMTTPEKIIHLVDFTKSLTLDFPEVPEHLDHGNWKDGGIALAEFAIEAHKFLELDQVSFAISLLNSFWKGVMGCANILTWSIQFIVGFISEMAKNGIHITAFWCESPVDIVVLDDWGRETTVTMEGEVINNIPRSEGSMIEDKKLILIPTIPCKAIINGRDRGAFDLTIVRGNHSTDVVVYEDVPTRFNSQAVIEISGTANYIMNLDKDGDGVFEEKIEPEITKEGSGFLKGTSFSYLPVVVLVIIVGALILFYKGNQRRTRNR